MKSFLIFWSSFLLFCTGTAYAQYEFSGSIDKATWTGDVMLSLIEDYRKISGVYPEQIIQKVTPDSTGYFSFSGNHLPESNRIYSIHIENCSETGVESFHFNGICPNSKEILFIANNTDTLSLPFSFDDEMFCKVVSKNEKSDAFIKIDSLINDMRFAFSSYRSATNRKLNSKKWFFTLQQFGEQSKEPLSELYIHSFLSNKTNELYTYYLKYLKSNPYYDQLLDRLTKHYPNSSYTKQYEAELASDKFLINPQKTATTTKWAWLLLGLLLLSIGFNIYYFFKLKKKTNITAIEESNLTLQEKRVLAFILEDKTNKEIAKAMFVSLSTVKTHINNLYKKLKVSSRGEVRSLFIENPPRV